MDAAFPPTTTVGSSPATFSTVAVIELLADGNQQAARFVNFRIRGIHG
jgi:hypothetical protein